MTMTACSLLIRLQQALDRKVYPLVGRHGRVSARLLRYYAAVAARLDPVTAHTFWLDASRVHASAAAGCRSALHDDPRDVAAARGALGRLHEHAGARAGAVADAIAAAAPSVHHRAMPCCLPRLAAVRKLEAIVIAGLPF